MRWHAQHTVVTGKSPVSARTPARLGSPKTMKIYWGSIPALSIRRQPSSLDCGMVCLCWHQPTWLITAINTSWSIAFNKNMHTRTCIHAHTHRDGHTQRRTHAHPVQTVLFSRWRFSTPYRLTHFTQLRCRSLWMTATTSGLLRYVTPCNFL